MSNINTNGIDVAYPVPGVNNNSQGFRDNFAAIKTNLNTAGVEITNLQDNAILKTALTGTVLNNDMNNGVISNVQTRGFRASTYNLGGSISGTVVINVNTADISYGTVSGNTTLQFSSWAPALTQSNVQLNLAISNSAAVISFPSSVVGVSLLENYASITGIDTISVPAGVTQINLLFSTVDCGTTVQVTPINRPQQSTEIVTRIPPSNVGERGDRAGTVCVGNIAGTEYIYVCKADWDGATAIWTRTALTDW
jgi:hypothetical protein